MITRRAFLEAAATTPLLGRLGASHISSNRRKRLAIITTVWKHSADYQHLGDRFLVGYPHQGRWHQPAVDVVSAYVDQRPQNDLIAARAKEFGFKVFPTVQEALLIGGQSLGVDAVLIIGSGGDYPMNDRGQKLDPRDNFFQQVVDVFRETRRAVPLFSLGHLSNSFSQAKEMVDAAERLRVPLLAGSELPVTWRLPSVDLPLDCKLESALMVGFGLGDASFQALEALQCIVERRHGGERGVKAVQLVEGDAVWQAGQAGRWSMELLEAALSRSNQLQGISRTECKPQNLVRNGQLKLLAKQPVAFFIEYQDGLKATLLLLNGAVADFTFAAQLSKGDIFSTLFYLPPAPNLEAGAELASRIEQMIVTGRSPYSVQRALLAGGIWECALNSRLQGNRRVETPQLNVTYEAPAESQFART